MHCLVHSHIARSLRASYANRNGLHAGAMGSGRRPLYSTVSTSPPWASRLPSACIGQSRGRCRRSSWEVVVAGKGRSDVR